MNAEKTVRLSKKVTSDVYLGKGLLLRKNVDGKWIPPKLEVLELHNTRALNVTNSDGGLQEAS